MLGTCMRMERTVGRDSPLWPCREERRGKVGLAGVGREIQGAARLWSRPLQGCSGVNQTGGAHCLPQREWADLCSVSQSRGLEPSGGQAGPSSRLPPSWSW